MRKQLLHLALTVTALTFYSLDSMSQSSTGSGNVIQANCNADFTYSIDNFGMVTFTPVVVDPALTYNWQFGDGGTSGAVSPKHLFLNGSYKVCLNAFDGSQCNAYLCHTVNVTTNTSPCTPIFTALQSLSQSNTFSFALYTNCATSAYSYAWSFGDGTAQAGVNPTHTYTAPGTYTVCASSYDSLGNAFTWCDYVVVPVILGVNENQAAKISIFPNPAKDNFTISNLLGGEIIKLSTIEGRVVSENINSDLTKKVMNVNDLPNGVYILTVQGEKYHYQNKMMINK